MTRRLALFASLLVLGLAGCTTYGDGYRDSYYRDGGYYYPAEDGYGDYYQGRDYADARYYDRYSYSPFWGLGRYSCGAFHSCSPYWNRYYRRPYSGWSFSFGSHWSYGSWGWYGQHWSPWYGPGYYHGHHHWHHRDRDHNRPPVTAPGPVTEVVRPLPRPDFSDQGWKRERPIDQEPTGPRPGYGGYGNGRSPGGEVSVRPLPRPDFRSDGRQRPLPWPEGEETVRPLPRADFRDLDQKRSRPAPQPYEEEAMRPRPGFRTEDRGGRTRLEMAPRRPPAESVRSAPERAEPLRPVQREFAPPPRMERPDRQEMRQMSQNETLDDER